MSVSLQTAAHLCMVPRSSVIRSDFISQVPRITTAGRHWTGTRGVTVGGLMGAKTQTQMKKKKKGLRARVCVRERERLKRGQSGRVMEEILLKVMNVTLSFLLYDPGAFANYPDSQRSGPSLLPTREKLGSSAKRWPCYRIHRGQWLQPEIITF